MRTFAILSLCLAACEQDYNAGRLTQTDEFDQAPSNEVDILWVIDDSTSMQEEQASVKAAGADFIAQLETADMDFHIGLVTTDGDSTNAKASQLLGEPTVLNSTCRDDGNTADCTYQSDFEARIEQGTGGSDQEKGLEVALDAVRPPLSETMNVGFMRPDALLMVIILSDENDCSDGGRLGPTATGEDCYTRYDELTPVGDIVAAMRDAKAELGKGNVEISGIIGPDAAEGCTTAVPGFRYDEAIKVTGGVEADICLGDYSPVMQSLGLAATGISTTFQLTYAADQTSIEVTVKDSAGNETKVDEDATNGWTYLEDYAQIQFNGTAVPARESHITVTYFSAGPVPDPPSSSSAS